jgi:hypothetical protein
MLLSVAGNRVYLNEIVSPTLNSKYTNKTTEPTSVFERRKAML